MRAFCHKRQRFSDFVLARILRIDGFEATQVDSNQDSHWQTVLTLVLAPHPDLPAAKKRVLELDYRSEEHTSEPSHQIISYAVFCLKKKKEQDKANRFRVESV